MKRVLNIAGAVLLALGALWMLQGFGVLPGGMMSGHREWAMYGGCAFVLGVGVLLAGRTPRGRRRGDG